MGQIDEFPPNKAAELERIERQAREIAAHLEEALNPEGTTNEPVGFALLLFSFGEAGEACPCTWISNADRGDMIRAIGEWLERAKARS